VDGTTKKDDEMPERVWVSTDQFGIDGVRASADAGYVEFARADLLAAERARADRAVAAASWQSGWQAASWQSGWQAAIRNEAHPAQEMCAGVEALQRARDEVALTDPASPEGQGGSDGA